VRQATGEILPQCVMTGYYGQEDRDKEVFPPLTVTSGTGDIGLMDEKDFFKIIDRKELTRLLSGI
jgi:long-subunit acyl-CoA synthetase (AMP-forming)